MALGLLAGVLLAGVVVALSRIPTDVDARVSDTIRVQFVQSATNRLDSKVSIICSPRRGSTMILISGATLSEAQKRSLSEIAADVGRANGNRIVTLVFNESET